MRSHLKRVGPIARHRATLVVAVSWLAGCSYHELLVVADNAPIFAEPSVNAKVVATARRGQRLRLAGAEESKTEWQAVQQAGGVAYISIEQAVPFPLKGRRALYCPSVTDVVDRLGAVPTVVSSLGLGERVTVASWTSRAAESRATYAVLLDGDEPVGFVGLDRLRAKPPTVEEYVSALRGLLVNNDVRTARRTVEALAVAHPGEFHSEEATDLDVVRRSLNSLLDDYPEFLRQLANEDGSLSHDRVTSGLAYVGEPYAAVLSEPYPTGEVVRLLRLHSPVTIVGSPWGYYIKVSYRPAVVPTPVFLGELIDLPVASEQGPPLGNSSAKRAAAAPPASANPQLAMDGATSEEAIGYVDWRRLRQFPVTWSMTRSLQRSKTGYRNRHERYVAPTSALAWMQAEDKMFGNIEVASEVTPDQAFSPQGVYVAAELGMQRSLKPLQFVSKSPPVPTALVGLEVFSECNSLADDVDHFDVAEIDSQQIDIPAELDCIERLRDNRCPACEFDYARCVNRDYVRLDIASFESAREIHHASEVEYSRQMLSRRRRGPPVLRVLLTSASERSGVPDKNIYLFQLRVDRCSPDSGTACTLADQIRPAHVLSLGYLGARDQLALTILLGMDVPRVVFAVVLEDSAELATAALRGFLGDRGRDAVVASLQHRTTTLASAAPAMMLVRPYGMACTCVDRCQ